VKHLQWGAALDEPLPEPIVPIEREIRLLNHEGREEHEGHEGE
jgi:hypothetical protein